MASAKTPNGTEKNLRVIVFREGDVYVAQCIEYDIAAQGATIESVIDRLELTIDAEFAFCGEDGKEPRESISPAPVYYHKLWEDRMFNINRAVVATPGIAPAVEYALAKAA